MAVERDEGTEDELIRNAVAELRRPVALDPAIDTRALDAIRGRRKAEGRRRWMAAAAAALAAGVALAVLPHPRDPRADETRQVQLLISAPASHVAVVGDFNDWDPVATPLRPTADPGVWTVELRLKPGRYHYSFLLDGQRWVRDPAEPPVAESDFGTPISVLTVS